MLCLTVSSAIAWAQELPNTTGAGELPDAINMPGLPTTPGVEVQRIGGAPASMVLASPLSSPVGVDAELAASAIATSSVELSASRGSVFNQVLSSTNPRAATANGTKCSTWSDSSFGIPAEQRARAGNAQNRFSTYSGSSFGDAAGSSGNYSAGVCEGYSIALTGREAMAASPGMSGTQLSAAQFTTPPGVIPDLLNDEIYRQTRQYEGVSRTSATGYTAATDPRSDVPDLTGGANWFAEGLPVPAITLTDTPVIASASSIQIPGAEFGQIGLNSRSRQVAATIRRPRPRDFSTLHDRQSMRTFGTARRLHPKSGLTPRELDR